MQHNAGNSCKTGCGSSAYIMYVSRIWTSLTLLWWFDFGLEPIFATAQDATKNIAHFKKATL